MEMNSRVILQKVSQSYGRGGGEETVTAAGDITRAGYDIEANAERLRRIYFECAGRTPPGEP